jgi:glycogen(starch) synthase
MRILMVSEDIPQPHMGGLAKHALALCRMLVKMGHQVDILGNDLHTVDPNDAEANFGGRVFHELNGHFVQWKEPSLGMFLPQRRTWVARRFARVIMRHAPNYDVIHYHGHFPNVAKFIPSGVNFVQTRHDQGSDCLFDTRFRKGEICTETAPEACANCRSAQPNGIQRWFSTTSVKRFRSEVMDGFQRHKTVFVSDMLHRNFSRSCGEGPWGVTIHNFVDLEPILQARKRAAEAPPSGVVRVAVAAKLWAAKGVTPFVREFSRKRPSGMELTVVGAGPELSALRRDFESEHIRFAGWCDAERTLEIASHAQAIVVPSVWEEPCATTVLEGLLLGKTTFALASGGTPELAVYAHSPEQLRLHATMEALVEDLANADLSKTYPLPPDGLGSVERAANRLLNLYLAPSVQVQAMNIAAA